MAHIDLDIDWLDGDDDCVAAYESAREWALEHVDGDVEV